MATLLPLRFLSPTPLPRTSTIHQFLRTASLSTTKTTSAKPITPITSTISSSPSSSSSSTNPSLQKSPEITLERRVYPYRIHRTPSNQLPIYTLSQAGGNKKLTKLRKIEGDVQVLRRDLQLALGVEEKEVWVNGVTGHVMVKGHKVKEIKQFLEERRL